MQTSIDQYFKSRKRPADGDIGASYTKIKITARKLFDNGKYKVPEFLSSERNEFKQNERCKILEISPEMKSFGQHQGSKTPESSSEKKEIEQDEKSKTSELLPERNEIEQNKRSKTPELSPERKEIEQDDRCKTPELSTEIDELEQNEQCKTPELLSPDRKKLKQELGLGEFNEIIRRNKNLNALRQSLQDYKCNEEKLREIMKRKKEFGNKYGTVEFEIPTSPIKQPTTMLTPRKLLFSHVASSSSSAASPSKDRSYVSPRKLLDEGPSQSPIKPAYERFNHLVAAGKDPLILPFKYSALKEIFHSVDTIMKILSDRGEMVTFSKLKPDVQRMLNRNFTLSHLGQIKAVYPDSYDFNQQRIKMFFNQSEKYELVIKPGSGFSTLVKREKIFHQALLNHTKKLHEAFLRSLDPPIEINGNQVTRWHPYFDVDNVPDIQPVTLPEAPVENKILSAKTFLESQQNMLRCNNKIGRMLDSTETCSNKKCSVTTDVEKTSSVNEDKNIKNNLKSTPSVMTIQKALKGIPKSLLEKVRAKQTAKIAISLTQSPIEMKNNLMKSRLPELARIVRNIFVTEKKTVLPQEFVLLKVTHSYRENLSRNEFLDHFKFLSNYLPWWISIFKVSNMDYMKLSKDSDMNRVIGKLEMLINK